MESVSNARGPTMSQQKALTTDEQMLNDAWEEHLRSEFNARSADDAIATMVPNPLGNQASDDRRRGFRTRLRHPPVSPLLPRCPRKNRKIVRMLSHFHRPEGTREAWIRRQLIDARFSRSRIESVPSYEPSPCQKPVGRTHHRQLVGSRPQSGSQGRFLFY